MTDNDLITLAEREAQRLTDENDHGAAVIMRALMERVRMYRDSAKKQDHFTAMPTRTALFQSV